MCTQRSDILPYNFLFLSVVTAINNIKLDLKATHIIKQDSYILSIYLQNCANPVLNIGWEITFDMLFSYLMKQSGYPLLLD